VPASASGIESLAHFTSTFRHLKRLNSSRIRELHRNRDGCPVAHLRLLPVQFVTKIGLKRAGTPDNLPVFHENH
jgi:hypothetical protein